MLRAFVGAGDADVLCARLRLLEKSWHHQTIGWPGADARTCGAAPIVSARWLEVRSRAPSGLRSRSRTATAPISRRGTAVASRLPLPMKDRRRTSRYVLATPLSGDAMPMEDVTVEEYTRGHVVVITPSVHPVNEELIMHVSTSDGLQSRRATVQSSTPVSVAGALHYRVELRVDDDAVPSGEGRESTHTTS